ncbi:hypothetical protein E2C01_079594 [Portunus trituberculatus]|uniref:Uncharacterized protein n=1 Tax=Portunus trituberculatus TaxID=210409 RepID=A0A5B7IQR0_PORTR|nr:hypothetical protein [Portunus trituberculatus]
MLPFVVRTSCCDERPATHLYMPVTPRKEGRTLTSVAASCGVMLSQCCGALTSVPKKDHKDFMSLPLPNASPPSSAGVDGAPRVVTLGLDPRGSSLHLDVFFMSPKKIHRAGGHARRVCCGLTRRAPTRRHAHVRAVDVCCAGT